MDKRWLGETGYPVTRDGALFYTDFLKKGDDGLYHAFPSNQGEDGFSGDPKDYTDRPQIMRHMRYCLRAAIAAAEALDADPGLRAEWRDRLDHAAPDDGLSAGLRPRHPQCGAAQPASGRSDRGRRTVHGRLPRRGRLFRPLPRD